MSAIAISPEVAVVLGAAETSGNLVRLTGSLDRRLYETTNKILEALGGKWDRKARAHVFPIDAEQALSNALASGSAIKRQQTLQFFETPTSLASRMVDLARIVPGDAVLEPSAGHGRLLLPLGHRTDIFRPVAIEIDEANCSVLRKAVSASIVRTDFLTWSATCVDEFDVVLMNPPFSGNQDIAHIKAAWSLLRAGGRLVAVASEHGFMGQERTAVAFRMWLDEIAAVVEPIPAGTFVESGTRVSARLIIATKTSIPAPRHP